MPLLSIVIPTLNSENYLKEALASIANQHFKDYECIVVDGGSSDSTLSILDDFKSKVNRLKVIQNKCGNISKQLNDGIKSGDSKFIGRMDSDDICLPNRFNAQIDMLNNGFSLVGGAVNLFGATPNRKIIYPEMGEMLSLYSIIRNPFAHPAVVIARNINPFYNEKYNGVEDYELWSRIILEKKYKLINIKEPVINYRVHKKQISKKVDERIINLRFIISQSLFSGLNIENKYFDVIKKLSQLVPVNATDIELFVELFNATRVSRSPDQDFIWFEELRKSANTITEGEITRVIRALNEVYPGSLLINFFLFLQFISPYRAARFVSKANTFLFSKLNSYY